MKPSGNNQSVLSGIPPALCNYIRIARQMQVVRLPRDASLTRQRLVPARKALLELARRHRLEADAYFRHMPAEQAVDDEFQAGASGQRPPYPLGCCRKIRDRVWNGLSNETLIRSLCREGLTWKKIYFIEEGRWFQNAIQCGDWMLDAAHDTVDASDTPVIMSPLDELVWENLDSWRRFAEVAVCYYRVTVYPNLYFPLLFPMIPFLAVRETGRLEFLFSQQMLFFLDIGDNWRRIMALFGDRSLMAKALPPALERSLEEMVEAGKEPFPVELRKCTADELRQTLRDWDQIRGLPGPQIVETVRNFEKLASLAARRLRQANIALTSA